jgi:hypothetical protein
MTFVSTVRVRAVGLAVLAFLFGGTAIAGDDKIVHGAECVPLDMFYPPVTYGIDGVFGDQFSPEMGFERSGVYCPLVRDNSAAEVSNVYVRVFESHAGEQNKKINCKICTSNGLQNVCSLSASAVANGVQSITLDLASIDAFANEAYVVWCTVGLDSRVRSVKYTEP